MAFYAFYGIAVGVRGEAFRADGDALIKLDSFSYDGSFTYHHACAVVNEEVFTDLCSRVDVDTCRPVSQFGYEAGQNGQLDAIEKVSDPVSRKSFDRGVAKDYFHTAGSSGIAFIGGGDIGHEQTSYFGKGCGKRGGSFKGFASRDNGHGSFYQHSHSFSQFVISLIGVMGAEFREERFF